MKQLKFLFFIAGMFSLIIGFIGLLVPIMPTSPFLIIAAVCFFRSSEKMYNWLIHHRIFGRYIRGYLDYRALPLSTKIFSVLFLWIAIGTSLWLFVKTLWIALLILAITFAVSIYLLRLKTLSKEMEDQWDVKDDQNHIME